MSSSRFAINSAGSHLFTLIAINKLTRDAHICTYGLDGPILTTDLKELTAYRTILRTHYGKEFNYELMQVSPMIPEIESESNSESKSESTPGRCTP